VRGCHGDHRWRALGARSFGQLAGPAGGLPDRRRGRARGGTIGQRGQCALQRGDLTAGLGDAGFNRVSNLI
jgi:hypothetical protein